MDQQHQSWADRQINSITHLHTAYLEDKEADVCMILHPPEPHVLTVAGTTSYGCASSCQGSVQPPLHSGASPRRPPPPGQLAPPVNPALDKNLPYSMSLYSLLTPVSSQNNRKQGHPPPPCPQPPPVSSRIKRLLETYNCSLLVLCISSMGMSRPQQQPAWVALPPETATKHTLSLGGGECCQHVLFCCCDPSLGIKPT